MIHTSGRPVDRRGAHRRGSRAAENARRLHLLQVGRPSTWARVTRRVGATATRLGGALYHRPAAPAAVPCPCALTRCGSRLAAARADQQDPQAWTEP